MNPSRRRPAGAAVAAACFFALAGCRSLPPGAECWSLDGRALVSPPPAADAAARLADDLRGAERTHAERPDDRDAAIWHARRLGYLGRYRDAVAVLTAALARHPGDPFLLRHRGHRWLTLREFAAARADLRAAADACRTTPDATEPDGQPTPGRPPHSSLHYNVHYHLGLACFLLGDFAAAECAWLDCLAVVDDDESRVAVTHWLWCARMRAGDPAGAFAVVAPIHAGMDVVENVAYLNLCLLYRGDRAPVDLAPRAGSSGSALAFGLAHHALVTGDRARARAELAALAASPGWSAFGVIAAEAELARWRD
jgi:tetratricopeptide (TPR) repeat protein